jgi:hypothetical protein
MALLYECCHIFPFFFIGMLSYFSYFIHVSHIFSGVSIFLICFHMLTYFLHVFTCWHCHSDGLSGKNKLTWGYIDPKTLFCRPWSGLGQSPKFGSGLLLNKPKAWARQVLGFWARSTGLMLSLFSKSPIPILLNKFPGSKSPSQKYIAQVRPKPEVLRPHPIPPFRRALFKWNKFDGLA